MGATEQKPQKSTTQQALNSTNLEKIRSVFCVFGRSNLRGNSKTVRIQQQEFQHCNIRNGRSSCFPVGRQSQLHLVPWRVFDKWVVLKKQSENIDSMHSNAVTHAATQIHPSCSVWYQYRICLHYVNIMSMSPCLYHVIAFSISKERPCGHCALPGCHLLCSRSESNRSDARCESWRCFKSQKKYKDIYIYT